MRLWHYKLIKYLPTLHLRTQWNELCAISAMVNKKKKHATTVDRIIKEKPENLLFYTYLVQKEMNNRNLRVSKASLETLKMNINYNIEDEYSFKEDANLNIVGEIIFKDKNLKISINNVFEWMDNRYLVQNFFMFQERFDIGMISETEFNKVCECMEKAGLNKVLKFANDI